MEFEQNNNIPEPAAQPPYVKPAKKGRGWRIFLGIFTTLSVVVNIFLFLAVIGLVAFTAVGQKGVFNEEVIQSGPKTSKIVVINLRGIINGEKSRDIVRQVDAAARDPHVKGLIVRINSPGGGVSASDQIYNEIRKYRARTGKPAVAFMEGLAASGGYYAAVACEKIVAEPTTITGSIGVIMGYFVLQELFEEKLGIQPVIVKSGEKKDWPSSFEPPSEEQRKYLEEKLIGPAYKRFVELIAYGRPMLTLAEVEELADGSIYSAGEALERDLIDHIGYLDEAIKLVKTLSGIENARVVEYSRPFSLSGILGAQRQSLLKLDRTTLYELNTPELMYLWRAY